jgi:hypothetical protein
MLYRFHDLGNRIQIYFYAAETITGIRIGENYRAKQQDIQCLVGAEVLPSLRVGRGRGWVDSPKTTFRSGLKINTKTTSENFIQFFQNFITAYRNSGINIAS